MNNPMIESHAFQLLTVKAVSGFLLATQGTGATLREAAESAIVAGCPPELALETLCSDPRVRDGAIEYLQAAAYVLPFCTDHRLADQILRQAGWLPAGLPVSPALLGAPWKVAGMVDIFDAFLGDARHCEIEMSLRNPSPEGWWVVGGDARVRDIQRPFSMITAGHLAIEGCPELLDLPARLRVRGELRIQDCPALRSLPDDLVVEGHSIELTGTSIPDLEVGNPAPRWLRENVFLLVRRKPMRAMKVLVNRDGILVEPIHVSADLVV